MSDPIFVVSQVEIYHGADALAKLAETNDSKYASENGVLKVDAKRWQKAQKYERETWLTYNPQMLDDRNGDHKRAFADYAALPETLGDVTEVGCGAFTNLRLILPDHAASTVTLLDPLIKDYLEHPNCAYKDERLCGYPVKLIDKPIEKWLPTERYDTLVMENVLPHCYDAEKVLQTVVKALKPNGLIVFHEAPREHDPLRHYDEGHPIAPTANFLEAFITSNFVEVYRNGWYFIGRRNG